MRNTEAEEFRKWTIFSIWENDVQETKHACMDGILGKSWELHVPHFQRLNDLHNNVNTDASNTAHMLPSKKIKARGRFNTSGD